MEAVAPPELELPELDPPELAPPVREPPEGEPPDPAPPEPDPPELEPPELDPPELAPTKLDPPNPDPPEPPGAPPPALDPPAPAPPELDPPVLAPPRADPSELDPPVLVPSEPDPPVLDTPEPAPPKLAPPELASPELDPPEFIPVMPALELDPPELEREPPKPDAPPELPEDPASASGLKLVLPLELLHAAKVSSKEGTIRMERKGTTDEATFMDSPRGQNRRRQAAHSRGLGSASVSNGSDFVSAITTPVGHGLPADARSCRESTSLVRCHIRPSLAERRTRCTSALLPACPTAWRRSREKRGRGIAPRTGECPAINASVSNPAFLDWGFPHDSGAVAVREPSCPSVTLP